MSLSLLIVYHKYFQIFSLILLCQCKETVGTKFLFCGWKYSACSERIDGHASRLTFNSTHFSIGSEKSLTGWTRQVEGSGSIIQTAETEIDMNSDDHLILTSETRDQTADCTQATCWFRHMEKLMQLEFLIVNVSRTFHYLEMFDFLCPDEIFIDQQLIHYFWWFRRTVSGQWTMT